MEKNIFKDAVEAPALMIDRAANTTKKVNKEIASQEQVKAVRGYLRSISLELISSKRLFIQPL